MQDDAGAGNSLVECLWQEWPEQTATQSSRRVT